MENQTAVSLHIVQQSVKPAARLARLLSYSAEVVAEIAVTKAVKRRARAKAARTRKASKSRERYSKDADFRERTKAASGRSCSARPLMVKAIRIVAAAIRRGDLLHPSRLDCADCGEPARDYDHRDYTKPLEVEPVCRSCNKRRGPGKPYC